MYMYMYMIVFAQYRSFKYKYVLIIQFLEERDNKGIQKCVYTHEARFGSGLANGEYAVTTIPLS